MGAPDNWNISPAFRNRADSACFYEAWVGSVLSRAGLYTVHHPFTIAQSKKEVASYHLTWDMDVSLQAPGSLDYVPIQVEVKSVNLTFHHTKDYPFGEAMVCSQSSFLRKWPGSSRVGRDFLFVSRDTGNVIWLPKGTAVTLGHEARDGTRGDVYKVAKVDRKYLSELQDFVEYVREPWPTPRDSEGDIADGPKTPRR